MGNAVLTVIQHTNHVVVVVVIVVVVVNVFLDAFMYDQTLYLQAAKKQGLKNKDVIAAHLQLHNGTRTTADRDHEKVHTSL